LLLKPLKRNTGEAVAAELMSLIALVGPPKILQSDNGPEFANDVMRALVKLLGVQHRFITPYNPRADGKVERSVGTTVMIIKKLLHGSTHHWPLFLPFAQMQFNEKISSLTGSTPFALFFGRRMNPLRDYTNDKDHPQLVDLENWRDHQEKLLSLVYPAISERVKSLKDEMVKRLNKHRRLLTDSIPVGATVMIKDPRRENKFEPKYIGPYTVIRRAQNGAYVLRDQTGDIFDRHVTADQIKLISKKPREVDTRDAEQIYEVDHIVDHRGEAGHYQFLVRWKGYEASDDSWVDEVDFQDNRCIRDYWKRERR
jgi:hypothetical protein